MMRKIELVLVLQSVWFHLFTQDLKKHKNMPRLFYNILESGLSIQHDLNSVSKKYIEKRLEGNAANC